MMSSKISTRDNDVEAAAMIPTQVGSPVEALPEAGIEAELAELLEDELEELEPSVDVDLVWAEFKATGSRALREQLILHYAPLVTGVAGRVGMRLPSTVEQADLVSYGMFGLIDAIEKYELDRSVKFETYATARIRGAIIDELRAIDWIPRSVRTKARQVDRAYAELEAELHRTPSEQEVAARLEIGLNELRSVFTQLSTVNVAALDELLGSGTDRGDAVRDLQTALSGAGYPVAADGVFGPLTEDAVRRFQRDAGLVVDGVAGPRTRTALRNALSLPQRLRNWWNRLLEMVLRT